MRLTIDTHFAPGKTIHELHELAQSGSGIDLLKEFSEVAREELRAFAVALFRYYGATATSELAGRRLPWRHERKS